MVQKKQKSSRVLMEEMTSDEVGDALKAGKVVALIFSASTEASGPHLVLGKHIFRARHLGEQIARELGNALVAPVMPFAPTTDEARFPGTVNLSAKTFSQVNQELANSMVKTGFKFIILMGDHDGNQQPLQALAHKLDKKYRPRGVRVFYSGDAYHKSGRQIEAYLQKKCFPASRHAGVADTSAMMAVGAEHVRRDKIAMGGSVPPAGSPLDLGTTGVEGDPRKSSVELGEMILQWKVKNAVAEIRNLIKNSEARSQKS